MYRKQPIRLTESQLRRIVTESTKRILDEMNWKTLVNAAKKAREQGRTDMAYDFEKAAERALDREFPQGNHHVYPSDECEFQRIDRRNNGNLEWSGWRPFEGHEESWPVYVDFGTKHKYNPEKGVVECTPKDDEKEIGDFLKGKYEYIDGIGWRLKNS